jgi:two-component system response regulator YesN
VYNVLLVDDERIIREGLARTVPWRRYGLHLFGEAADGSEGLQKIRENDIHIVITDIKMPGSDGLELIREASRIKPALRFVVLSGYDEFEFAQQAMQHGVRYYLLKPTKMQEIDRILKELTRELSREEEEQRFVQTTRQAMQKSLPLIKEQFFRDLIMHKLYTSRELHAYLSFFGISPDAVRNVTLVLFSPGGEAAYEQLFSLQLICQRCFEEPALLLATIVKDALAVVVNDLSTATLVERVREIKSRYRHFYDEALTVALSDAAPLEAIHTLYEQARHCLGHRFHCGQDCIITPQDTVGGEQTCNENDLGYFVEEACVAMQCGNESDYREAIRAFWSELRRAKLPRPGAHSAAVDLLLAAARYNRYENVGSLIDCLKRIEETETLEGLEAVIDECCLAVVRRNFEVLTTKKSRLVEKMKQQVRDNLANPDLSLKWLGGSLIHANVDYLSKLFKRETGEPFRHYVSRLRVEKAAECLTRHPDAPIAEVARDTGFGDNARYFCLVFRKATGCSPTEYRHSRAAGR